MESLRRRVSAAIASGALIGGTALAGLAVGVVGTVATAVPAGASLVTTITYNDNGCTNNVANTTGVALIPIGLGSDQTDAALTNTVDPVTGATSPGVGNITVANGNTFTPSGPSVVVGGSSQLTNVTGHGFVPAAFLQAGVNLHIITIGQTLNGTINVIIDAANATFPNSQPAGVTWRSSTQVLISGVGSGTVVGINPPYGTVTEPIDVATQFPNVNFTAANSAGTAFFYQDNSLAVDTGSVSGGVLVGGPGGGNGDFNGTTNLFPTTPLNATAQVTADLGALGTFYMACQPGTINHNLDPTIATFTQTAIPDGQFIFAAQRIAAAEPPVLQPQTLDSVNVGGSGVIHALQGATDNVPIDPSSVTVVTPPTYGTTSVNPANGDITYTNNGSGAGLGDSFTVTAASAGGVSAPVTETITMIVSHPSTCDVTVQASCTLDQIILVPVTGADLVMSQATGLPTDLLNHTLVSGVCTGGAITLNGQPQFACGAMFPVTVVNARGTDAGWTLTGQVSDFLDAAAPPGTTCDTPATYSNDCIPGGNLSWDPVAAVAHGIVAGDTAQVSPGIPVLAGLNVLAPTTANAAALLDAAGLGPNGALAPFGSATQTNPVVEPSPPAGLHDAAQTLCSTASGASGGTFVCGAGLIVAVPASAAADTTGYQATLTLTLA